jgi:predicted NUDIX family NTP pyrophosphohydrolase
MTSISCGILLYRMGEGYWEVFLVHPGGPFWVAKDRGAWSLPKGLAGPGEDFLSAARREFKEETGFEARGKFEFLTPLRQKSGKWIQAWAVEGDLDAQSLKSNFFEMEWPPRSGKKQNFPEADRGGWFPPGIARERIAPGQLPFLEEFYGRHSLRKVPG